MRILRDKTRTPVDIDIMSGSSPLPKLIAVEPSSTVATLDNFQQVAGFSRLLISKAIRVSQLFGISAASGEVSAREVIVPFAWNGSSIELSKDAQSSCDKSEGARGKSRFPDGNAPERYQHELPLQ
jgi:hypothetical protein